MYAWIWGKLPGAWPVKVAESIAALAVLVLLLFVVVFPVIEPNLPFNNVTIDETGSSTPSESSVPTGSTSPAPPSKATAPPTPSIVQEGNFPTAGDLNGDQTGSTEVPVGPVTITPEPIPS